MLSLTLLTEIQQFYKGLWLWLIYYTMIIWTLFSASLPFGVHSIPEVGFFLSSVVNILTDTFMVFFFSASFSCSGLDYT
jgi:hypothetical protein